MIGEDSAKYSRFASHAVELLEGKWKMQIFCVIRKGPVRMGQLARLISSASKKVLTENLRELESTGVLVRRDLSGTVRHVEYDFSTKRLVLEPEQSAGLGRAVGEAHRRCPVALLATS